MPRPPVLALKLLQFSCWQVSERWPQARLAGRLTASASHFAPDHLLHLFLLCRRGKAEVSGDFLFRHHLPPHCVPPQLCSPHCWWRLEKPPQLGYSRDQTHVWCHTALGSRLVAHRGDDVLCGFMTFLQPAPLATRSCNAQPDVRTVAHLRPGAGFPVSVPTLLALSLKPWSLTSFLHQATCTHAKGLLKLSCRFGPWKWAGAPDLDETELHLCLLTSSRRSPQDDLISWVLGLLLHPWPANGHCFSRTSSTCDCWSCCSSRGHRLCPLWGRLILGHFLHREGGSSAAPTQGILIHNTQANTNPAWPPHWKDDSIASYQSGGTKHTCSGNRQETLTLGELQRGWVNHSFRI